MYLILFSKVSLSLLVPDMSESIAPEDLERVQDSFLASKTFYIITLAIFISPIVVKESLAELKINTYVIFTGVFCLTLIMGKLLIQNGTYEQRLANDALTQADIKNAEAIAA